MGDSAPSVVVTGISGNLGRRLLPLLGSFRVVGVDSRPPETDHSLQFEQMDLAEEASCLQLLQLFKDVRPVAVLHLAFGMDAVRRGMLDSERVWKTNVPGTARVMEAVTEANRDWPMVEKFIFLSSVSAYGPDLSNPATEETPLAAHTYQYGMQKMESDRVVQQRAPALRGCSVYILRPQVFAGDGIENCFIEAFRGVPGGSSKRAERMRAQGKRLPCLLPSGKKYLSNRIQFVHIDDVARLVAFILKKTDPEAQRLTVLNVAGRGTPLTFEQCINIAQAKLVRIPTERLFDWVLQFFWKMRISTIPPDVMPYLLSDSVIETARLQEFLNAEYKDVIKYPIAEAFAECFK
ncbi:MAG TPA: NAD-dependent epimerase/dehydratase family protein [Terriglobales bacterium]|jgi:nucleoside-diphosphate-sugar epimerase|nr:NAD-dependent epimerase/dehydratase family protein [Terriglobales bacterium]